jgi:hypothetical protein
MTDWVNGNVPEDKNKYYWLTLQICNKKSTHETPCRYWKEQNIWVDFEQTEIDCDCVIAYCPIVVPRDYAMIGNGLGYYIRTVHQGKECIYGMRLCSANLGGDGYKTIDKAKIGLRNMRKQDINVDNYERDSYEVVDGYGNIVWQFKKKEEK